MSPDSERKCASGRDKNVHIRYVVVKNYHLISKNMFIIPQKGNARTGSQMTSVII